MATNFLLESFEKHKSLGIRSFHAGDVREAKYHFLKAAEYLLELALQTEPGLREVRTKQAMKLLELAKNVKQKRRAVREKAAARAAPGGGSSAEDSDEVPDEWLVEEKPSLRFGDIAGLEDVKEQIRVKMIYPFTHAEQAKKYRIKTGGGILLYGP
ncbi:MAG TPA: hypothetical protein VFC86_03315, partial [Planctomycetota bacterium]|nr:hypothetical protein [Planctomycetota bacterium]